MFRVSLYAPGAGLGQMPVLGVFCGGSLSPGVRTSGGGVMATTQDFGRTELHMEQDGLHLITPRCEI